MSFRSAFSVRGGQNQLSQYEDDEDVISELKSARLKLATMKVRQKLDNIDHIDDIKDRLDAHHMLDSDLQGLIELEESHLPKSPIKIEIKPKKLNILDSDVKESARRHTDKSLLKLEDTFSLIFQALVVLVGSQMPNSPLERERVGKRSREFEARLKRNSFEAKQQMIILRGKMLQLGLQPKDKTLSNQTISKVIRSLRNLVLIWQSCLHHLPLSGGYLFPPALGNVLKLSEEAVSIVEELGFDPLGIGLHLDKLLAAFKRFQSNSKYKVDKTPMATPSVKAPPATKSLSDESKLRLINNLAKQKFGNPPRPKSAVSVRSNYSSFHVKSNKEVAAVERKPVVLDYSPVRRVSRTNSPENFSKHFPSQVSVRPFNQEKSIKEESVNLCHEDDDDNSSSNVKNDVSRDRQTSIGLESIRHENEVMPDFSWHDIVKTSKRTSTIDQKTSVAEEDHSKTRISSKRRVSKLDLSDSDLRKILSEKHQTDKVESKTSKKINVEDNPESDLFYFNSVQIVSNLSCQLADEMLNSICHQMIESDLISKLIADELKG